MNKDINIAVIGCGNLGLSIVEGLLKSRANVKIIATRRNTKHIEHLTEQGVVVTDDNTFAIKNSNVILFGLKPYLILDIINEYKNLFTKNHIIISLATGISLNQIKENSGSCNNIFRAMPNIAASVCQSATCISNLNVEKQYFDTAKYVLDLFGTTTFIDEELMSAATILAGCGTAFALRFTRAMVEAGVQIGFKPEIAMQIVTQTVKGATNILENNGNHPEVEIDKVTTPKGVTITGLNEMENNGFSSAVIQGILAAYKKIEG
jgi:pyrroline-5-carboxylate reductase